jgi:hypothetical protein
MTAYRVAFNADTQVATILLPGHDLPSGAKEVGELNISSVSPNPTDVSTQHVSTMLQRKGFSDLNNLTVEIDREPVTEVIDQEDLPSTEENGEGLETDVLPSTLDLGAGESHDLVAGSTTGMKFSSSDEDVVKIGRGGSVKALKAGTATVTVTNKAGTSNDVVVTVREVAQAA